MFVFVLIQDLGSLGIVRRVQVDALNLPLIGFLEQAEGLPVVAVNQDAVGFGVQVGKGGEEAVGEVLGEVAGVQG